MRNSASASPAPAADVPRNLYALVYKGAGMEPRFMPGETLYIDPGKPVTAGCFVVIGFHEEPGGELMAIALQLIRRDRWALWLKSLDDANARKFYKRNLAFAHRIVGWGLSED
jgi:phage repressor protein C with HTH and peptisase S24 domain